MSPQYGELRPTSGWDQSGSLRHPCKFQRVSRLVCYGSLVNCTCLHVAICRVLAWWDNWVVSSSGRSAATVHTVSVFSIFAETMPWPWSLLVWHSWMCDSGRTSGLYRVSSVADGPVRRATSQSLCCKQRWTLPSAYPTLCFKGIWVTKNKGTYSETVDSRRLN